MQMGDMAVPYCHAQTSHPPESAYSRHMRDGTTTLDLHAQVGRNHHNNGRGPMG